MRNKDKNISLMPLSELQPSQLYINREKLENLCSRIDFSNSENVPPIPIKKMRGRWVMMDGHTRAFAAHLAGLDKVLTVPESDELDWEAYNICVNWCRDAGITEISDLEDRVIDADSYETRWIGRCKRMQDKLRENRK